MVLWFFDKTYLACNLPAVTGALLEAVATFHLPSFQHCWAWWCRKWESLHSLVLAFQNADQCQGCLSLLEKLKKKQNPAPKQTTKKHSLLLLSIPSLPPSKKEKKGNLGTGNIIYFVVNINVIISTLFACVCFRSNSRRWSASTSTSFIIFQLLLCIIFWKQTKTWDWIFS